MNLDATEMQLLELSNLSEPIATGTMVEYTQSFTDAVEQSLKSCEGVSHMGPLNAPD